MMKQHGNFVRFYDSQDGLAIVEVNTGPLRLSEAGQRRVLSLLRRASVPPAEDGPGRWLVDLGTAGAISRRVPVGRLWDLGDSLERLVSRDLAAGFTSTAARALAALVAGDVGQAAGALRAYLFVRWCMMRLRFLQSRRRARTWLRECNPRTPGGMVKFHAPGARDGRVPIEINTFPLKLSEAGQRRVIAALQAADPNAVSYQGAGGISWGIPLGDAGRLATELRSIVRRDLVSAGGFRRAMRHGGVLPLAFFCLQAGIAGGLNRWPAGLPLSAERQALRVLVHAFARGDLRAAAAVVGLYVRLKVIIGRRWYRQGRDQTDRTAKDSGAWRY